MHTDDDLRTRTPPNITSRATDAGRILRLVSPDERPPADGRVVHLANFSPSSAAAIRALLDAQPGPRRLVATASPPARGDAVGGLLVVRDPHALGTRSVLALARTCAPSFVLLLVRSLRDVAELRPLAPIPFVARELPLRPPDLVALLERLGRS